MPAFIRILPWLAFLLVLVPGCGSSLAQVEGVATLDDQELAHGNVVFHPVETGPSAVGNIASGRYSLSAGTQPGIPPGDYIATVVVQSKVERDDKEDVKTIKLLSPAKYSKKETSDLRVTVKPGRNQIPLKLTSK